MVSVAAMKRIEEIKQKRQHQFGMQRLRKGREVEDRIDIGEVQRNLSLIRSPAAGLKERKAQEESIVEVHESDTEMAEVEL